MATRHYVVMAGLHGCLPQYYGVCDSYADAVADLAQVHELGRDRTRELRRAGSLELNLQRDGNEYCEIVECPCTDASVHSDS